MSSPETPPDPSERARIDEAIEAAFPRTWDPRQRAQQPPPARAVPAAAFAAGDAVGEYLLLARIGRGGFGEVWEAQQTSLRRRVALKFLHPERADRIFLEYFAREARAGGRLSHPGVVAVHAHGETDGRPWIAMELIEGGRTLLDFIDERRALARESELPADHDRRSAEIAAELATILQAVHARGVIHRDLKPRNVFLGPDGRLKLGDFGLARIVDESALSDFGSFAGTYAYMSPEQISGRRAELDHRTDVFSLGAMLYELLALRQPFEGDTPVQVCTKIQHFDPPALSSLRSRVPADLVVICNKALEKEPARRYASMAELAEDLRRHLAHEPILARPPSAPTRARKWMRRHPAKSAAGAVALVALCALTALLVETLRARRDAEDAAARERERTVESTRLSSFRDLETLTRAADALWPAVPAKIDAFEAWIAEAEHLIDGLPSFRAQLAALQASDRAASSAQAELADVFARAQGAGGSTDEIDRAWRACLEKLVRGIEAFADERTGLAAADAIAPESGWSVPKRLAFARRVEASFAPGHEIARRWADCLRDLRVRHPELELAPQHGLVPIGRDPRSGLWEFWDMQSGAEPRRAADGTLSIGEESGLVFVLLPASSFLRGAQQDPLQPGYEATAAVDEAPARIIELSAHFLSKYEMTQGQWLRLTGSNPSIYRPGSAPGQKPIDLRHPVEHVSWNDAMRVLGRAGATLPTEAQWEHAARAGTRTPWWTGATRESLVEQRAANLADRSIDDAGWRYEDMDDWPELYDGWPAHAPVGTFAANAFGFHEVHGNLWEWCLDPYLPYFYEEAETRDPLPPPDASLDRSQRGGSFIRTARAARSAMRTSDAPTFSHHTLGVRPARAIQPGAR